MDEYIKREAAIAVIEEKQKELCPLGRYSRTMVYGSDRDRFDSWQEMINSIEDIPAADVVEVRHGNWIHREDFDYVDNKNAKHWHGMCDQCGFIHDFLDCHTGQYNYCPNCGAKMTEDRHEQKE